MKHKFKNWILLPINLTVIIFTLFIFNKRFVKISPIEYNASIILNKWNILILIYLINGTKKYAKILFDEEKGSTQKSIWL